MFGKSVFISLALFPFVLLMIIIIIISCGIGSGSAKMDQRNSGVDLLLLISRDYGANYFLNRDVFEQYGWNITQSGVIKEIPGCPPYYYHYQLPTIKPDILNGQIKNVGDFECLAIMPASAFFSPVPFDEFINDSGTLELISSAVKNDVPISSMCAGVRVLAAADVIRGIEVVGNPKFQDEYEAAGATFVGKDHPPVISGGIITASRDMYYSMLNCQAIATAIENRQATGEHQDYPQRDFIFSDAVEFTDDTIMWARTYGGEASDGGRAMCETEDGGFLITGYTFSHGNGDADILVVKTDAAGIKVWSKTFGGAGTEYGHDCLTLDDGYLIAGYTTSFGAGSKDVYLIKTDRQGEVIWSRTYGGAGWDVGNMVIKADDGGFVICGFTHSDGAGEEDVFIIKTDDDGNEIWSKTYGGERFEIGNSIYNVDGGGYIIGATSGSTEGGNTDFYLIRIDSDGNELWSKKFASSGSYGHGFDWCSSMCPSEEGGYVMAGYSDCDDIMDPHIIKTDSEGNEVWSKTFGNSKFYDYGNSLCMTADDGILIGGTAKSVDSISTYNNDFYIVKLDADGNLAGQKVIGGDGSEWGSQVYETDTGDIILVGQTNDKKINSFDICLLKIKGI